MLGKSLLNGWKLSGGGVFLIYELPLGCKDVIAGSISHEMQRWIKCCDAQSAPTHL